MLSAYKPKESKNSNTRAGTQEILPRDSHANNSIVEDLYYCVHDKIDVQSNDNAHLGYNIHEN